MKDTFITKVKHYYIIIRRKNRIERIEKKEQTKHKVRRRRKLPKSLKIFFYPLFRHSKYLNRTFSFFLPCAFTIICIKGLFIFSFSFLHVKVPFPLETTLSSRLKFR